MTFPRLTIGLLLWVVMVCPVLAQEEQEKAGPAKPAEYIPVTTINPNIPTDQLKIIVKPLTKSELEGEAKAWFELLRNKARQIAAAQLGIKKTNEAMAANDQEAAKNTLEQVQAVKAKAEEDAKKAEQQITEAAQKELGLDGVKVGEPAKEDVAEGDRAENADDESPAEEPATEETTAEVAPAEKTAEAEKAVADTKGQLLVDVTVLQEERSSLINRLNIVLTSLELKGGDVAEYRKYISAVSPIEVDTSDVTATWATLVGWLVSKEGGQRIGWNLSEFILILIASWLIAKLVQVVTNWLLAKKLRLSQLAESLIARTIKNVVMIVGFAIALTALEIDITPIVAAIGATGLVVGLALQGTLSNFASGLMILINRPFDVGNVVTAGGVTGVIHQMNLVSTTFKTFDNQTIHVPNNSIWNNVITNITANHTRRVDMEFGIGYDDDFEQAEQIILDVVNAHEKVLKKPEPQVITHDLGESSVNIVCRPWARTEDWWQVKTEVIREVKRRFDEAGISIPFPQQDVHFHTKIMPPVDQG
ncbi:mechanosensitive ion channel domain-containing protein [Bremerella sp. JC817]|uniref:mechanosensitive ion channel family protein n=1 Tax=Bremerella sp. JC817 TaxID=3231756 RepID=UPI00345768C2